MKTIFVLNIPLEGYDDPSEADLLEADRAVIALDAKGFMPSIMGGQLCLVGDSSKEAVDLLCKNGPALTWRGWQQIGGCRALADEVISKAAASSLRSLKDVKEKGGSDG